MALQESFEKTGNFLFRYRSYLPLILLVAAVLVFVCDLGAGSLPTCISYAGIEIISLVLSGIGLLVRIVAVGHSPANTSGRNTKQQLADEINMTGIYSTVRHPLYLGNFFMWLGMAVLTANCWFVLCFALAYWIYYERIMYAEEQFLRKKFGQPYLDWAARTPAFVPAFGKWVASAYPFSMKKILKKEKNGVLAVFVILFIFHNIRYSILMGEFSIEFNWVLEATVISGVLYFILKMLKKYSSVLNEKGR